MQNNLDVLGQAGYPEPQVGASRAQIASVSFRELGRRKRKTKGAKENAAGDGSTQTSLLSRMREASASDWPLGYSFPECSAFIFIHE
uniref:Uncharacterized protein n=1 Tax=Sphaerodactylus townsendi TaxID=933632 RepID=A0ACB8FZR0_9SAUR